VRDLRRVSTRIAEAVAREARDSGVGKPFADGAIPQAVAEAQWDPVYRPFV
jgi:malic enzyme